MRIKLRKAIHQTLNEDKVSTGDMGGMMERIAAFHDEETAQWVDRTTRLFEPLLMVFIGLVIGVIVLALYMPIFELAGSLQ